MARLRNPLAGMWAGLSERERTLILSLVLVVFVMGTVLLFVLRDMRLSETQRKIDKMMQAIHTLRTQGAVYKERLKEKEAEAKRLSATPLMFASHLEEVATRVEGVEVTNQEEPPALDLGDGVRKRVIEFDVRNVTLDALVRFLVEVESKPGHMILVESLRIRSASATEDRLSAQVKVATWERSASDDEGEDK